MNLFASVSDKSVLPSCRQCPQKNVFKFATFIKIVQAGSQSSVQKQTQLLVEFHWISANTFAEGGKSALSSTQLKFQSINGAENLVPRVENT